jgi:radical SAM superfamily enzyme YgiQ (UPF0313 family)
MLALLVSTYDLGRQPFGLASAAAALRASGVEVSCLDLAKQRLDVELVGLSDVIAFNLPMHTATRLALPVIDRVRMLNPAARLCAYGLYAPLNASLLRERGVAQIVGGEFEDDLVACVASAEHSTGGDDRRPGDVPRVQFRIPLRDQLPPLTRYAAVQVGSERRVAGYTEASRGCKHRCRHCPIVPVYDGRFRIVPIPIVLADVRTQVEAGARHITFGDPDFFNGVRHAADLIRRFAAEFPRVSYDVTIKIEHLLGHRPLIPLLRETGCLFVTSAVEAVDDEILLKLQKGHTRAGFEEAVALCRAAGLTLAPTFVAFTPWTTLSGYCELLQTIARLDVIEHVAPIQLAIRLLVPHGSRLLELADLRPLLGAYTPASLIHPWVHRDPAVDALQRTVERIAGTTISADRRTAFARIWHEAHAAADLTAPRLPDVPLPARVTVPYLTEPWYC